MRPHLTRSNTRAILAESLRELAQDAPALQRMAEALRAGARIAGSDATMAKRSALESVGTESASAWKRWHDAKTFQAQAQALARSVTR